ncbi:NAD(FAD)-utilizing dehydrogenase [Rhizobium sp. R72]|uniref:TIGR03862 family flavoprotein n=1 Tax=unclassified Rhizobium TaxID=2613769 RepID=UPI000B5346DD|nr:MULTISPECIES: TIGR03862 family flavoprotein [unclassified Rhizobium]OWW04811.1 NAD(FAD)-utilizing dehydrogenase [Rhizobium sp. R72]OWW05868.1 NAD(FAD)-utilizing dehydrogenase [Rhizobium sp. R711]
MVKKQIAILGGGPAGLAAAESLSSQGYAVTVYDAMPTVARKFLLAGKSGLNITHSEDYESFASRFGASDDRLREALDGFKPSDVRAWAAGLGAETFVGSSGRVFPTAMKASPLLRAWLRRLETQNVKILTRHRWMGFSDGGYLIEKPGGVCVIQPDAALLSLGGASWPRLGSDGRWLPWLRDKSIAVDDFRPANCGFDVDWSEHLRERFSGEPVKSVTASSSAGTIPGEFVITRHGIEGSLVYAHAAALRDSLMAGEAAIFDVDLIPGRTQEQIVRELGKQDPKASLSTRLRKAVGIDGVKAALIRELAGATNLSDRHELASLIKALPISVRRTRPIAEAISSAGGITWDELDRNYMLKALPGLFVAGEMIDWEAPTGGYLLTACLATGRVAARGIVAWLGRS